MDKSNYENMSLSDTIDCMLYAYDQGFFERNDFLSAISCAVIREKSIGIVEAFSDSMRVGEADDVRIVSIEPEANENIPLGKYYIIPVFPKDNG